MLDLIYRKKRALSAAEWLKNTGGYTVRIGEGFSLYFSVLTKTGDYELFVVGASTLINYARTKGWKP